MLPGFNHNIRYKDKVFHVQTEDNGLDDAALVTQVFLGGQIVAIERSSYGDVLVEGLDTQGRDQRIRTLMQDQHKKLLKNLVVGQYDDRISVFVKAAAANAGAEGLEPVGEAIQVDLDSADLKEAEATTSSDELDAWIRAAQAAGPVHAQERAQRARPFTPLPQSLIDDLHIATQRGDGQEYSEEELLDALEADIRRQLPPRPGSTVPGGKPAKAAKPGPTPEKSTPEQEAPTQPPQPADARKRPPSARRPQPGSATSSDTLIDFGLPASLRKEIDMEIALRRAVRAGAEGPAPPAQASAPRPDARMALFRSAVPARADAPRVEQAPPEPEVNDTLRPGPAPDVPTQPPEPARGSDPPRRSERPKPPARSELPVRREPARESVARRANNEPITHVDMSFRRPTAPESRTVEASAPPSGASTAPDIPAQEAADNRKTMPMSGPPKRPAGAPPSPPDGVPRVSRSAAPPRSDGKPGEAAPRALQSPPAPKPGAEEPKRGAGEPSSPSIVVVERSLDEVILSYLYDDGSDGSR